MPLVFTVTNTGKAAITLNLMGREPAADFQVTDAKGARVWSLLRGRSLMAPLRLYPLEAGSRLTFRHTWQQRTDRGTRVRPGRYTVRAVLLTDAPGGLLSPEVRLEITE